jgi:signal transduction histidine kinase
MTSLETLTDTPSESKLPRLAFRMHPRVLSALGRDLVTNDIVAVIELVKNSYDALATRVDVGFGADKKRGPYLEILDNGHGMSREILENVWCVVATPFRKLNPQAELGRRSRPVTGDKGLGRLSAARLGSRLEMITKASDGPYLRVFLDWEELSANDTLEASTFEISELGVDPGIGRHGTRLRVFDPNAEWTSDRLRELRENLARLVSPFSSHKDFAIFLTMPGEDSEPLEVEAPEFLSKPKYAIRGHANAAGDVNCKYEYQPVGEGRPRSKSLTLTWEAVYRSLDDKSDLEPEDAGCGPFGFELRAWDLTSEDTLEISERFDIAKASIRQAIGAHQGISVYRDDIIVLPKSADARDWLGLDLRRVSKVGTRLSTSQIVGYVRITKKDNPQIEDTSDRERLASNAAVRAFQDILRAVVALLENERDQDRRKPGDEKHLVELFKDLAADELLAEMLELADRGASAAEAVPILTEFNAKLDRVRSAIQKRFTYYSRLATVGTIAEMLIHEIRNRTTIIGRTLRKVSEHLRQIPNATLESHLAAAEGAVAALEQLADRFAPLASRTFRRAKRKSTLEESVERCLGLFAEQIADSRVAVSGRLKSTTVVSIDPGELDSIFINLFSNALYWLTQSDGDRKLRVRLSMIQGGRRARVSVDDSGPGIEPEDAERVFWPGVTRKPSGIGMGLTVASELVAAHGGKMALVLPGRLGGATFEFDLPVAR